MIVALLLAAIGMVLAFSVIILIALIMAAFNPELRHALKRYISTFKD